MINQVHKNGEPGRPAKAVRPGGAYLGEPALVQKRPNKPGRNAAALRCVGASPRHPRERSQCGGAIPRSEGAVRIHSWGWRFGLTVVRASALIAKHAGRRSLRPLPCRLHAVCPDRRKQVSGGESLPTGGLRVSHVVTGRKRSVMMTIEVSLRLWPPEAGVTGVHKTVSKGLPYAEVDGTALPRPVF